MRKNATQPIEVICAYTGEKFLKSRKEYNKHLKRGCRFFFKNEEIARQATREGWLARDRLKPTIQKDCPQCHCSFEVRDTCKQRTYCSRQCSAKASNAELKADPERVRVKAAKVSKTSKQAWDKKPEQRRTLMQGEWQIRSCSICDSTFLLDERFRAKTCSSECYSKMCSIRISMEPNCGGQTNWKHHSYKNVSMDSSWEVDVAKWLDANNIAWERSRSLVFKWTDPEGRERRYYPDFYVAKRDIYLDPKNSYLIEKDRFKIEAVIARHGVRILWGLRDDVLAELQRLV